VVTGRGKKRKSAEEITIFKSLGIAVEDIASGYYVYCVALQKLQNSKTKSKL